MQIFALFLIISLLIGICYIMKESIKISIDEKVSK